MKKNVNKEDVRKNNAELSVELDVVDNAASIANESDGSVVQKTIPDRQELQEQRKRNSKVRGARMVFRAIDIIFYSSQNKCPYVNKTNSDTIVCTPDIVYDELAPEVCKFDHYRVDCEKPQTRPAVILIHGGGFTAGDKKYRKGRAQFFSLNGFSVFCVNYGLAPDYNFPDPLRHIVNAANYIYDHAEEYNIDRNRIFVDGDSSGGYYAAMLSAFNCSERLAGEFGFAPKFKIFGTLLNCGVYDMQTVLDTKYPFDIADGVILSLTGISGKDFDNYEHKDVCIPVDFVTKDFPPTFIIYSKNDAFCKGQGEVMLEKLESAGVYCEHYVARHSMSNHCFSLTWSGEDAAAANELMISFAKRLANDKIKL